MVWIQDWQIFTTKASNRSQKASVFPQQTSDVDQQAPRMTIDDVVARRRAANANTAI